MPSGMVFRLRMLSSPRRAYSGADRAKLPQNLTQKFEGVACRPAANGRVWVSDVGEVYSDQS